MSRRGKSNVWCCRGVRSPCSIRGAGSLLDSLLDKTRCLLCGEDCRDEEEGGVMGLGSTDIVGESFAVEFLSFTS